MSVWITDYVVVNQFSRPGLKLLGVKGIVMHWTADPGATDENEVNFFDGADGGGGRYASAHFFVDRDSARLDIPLNEVAYHANEKACKVPKLAATAPYYKGGGANLTAIGVEMCVEKDGNIHPETVARTADVVAELCRQFKLDPINDIYRHYDITGKNCPAPWVTNPQAFTDFKATVKTKLNGGAPKVEDKGIGTIEMVADSVIRKDPTANSDIVGNVKKGDKYIVHEYKDGWANIGGYVYKDQVKLEWSDVVIGGFNQFEIDDAFTQIKKAFPNWHVDKRKQ